MWSNCKSHTQTTGLSFVLSMMTDIRKCGYLRAHTDTRSTDTTHVHTFTMLCTHTTCVHMVRICEHAHVICIHHVHTHSVPCTCTPAPPSPTHLFMIMLWGSTPDRWKWRSYKVLLVYWESTKLRSCVKVQVAILNSLSLMVSVDIKQHWTWTWKSTPIRSHIFGDYNRYWPVPPCKNSFVQFKMVSTSSGKAIGLLMHSIQSLRSFPALPLKQFQRWFEWWLKALCHPPSDSRELKHRAHPLSALTLSS